MAIVDKLTVHFDADTSKAMQKLKELREASSQAGKGYEKGDSIGRLRGEKNVAKTTREVKKLGAALKGVTPQLTKFTRSIMRIAWYRTIRFLVSNVVKAVKEGTTNLYEWGKIVGDDFSSKVYGLGNSWKFLKNQIGAATGTLLSGVLTQFDNLITKVAEAITWVSKLFAFLTGQSYYYEAVKSNKTLAEQIKEENDATKDATKSAKEYQKQLLGFDRINNLTPPSDSSKNGGKDKGSGNGDVDAGTFVKKQLGDWGQNSSFLVSFKDVFFEWKNLTKEQILEKIVAGLGAITGAAIGWNATHNLGGAVLGAILGSLLGVAIDGFTFNHDGKVSGKEIVSLIMTAVFGVAGGILGWKLGGTTGAAVGFSLLATVGAKIMDWAFEGDKSKKWTAKDVWSLIMGAVWGLTLGALGFIFGTPVGGAIGLTAGFSIGVKITKFLFKNSKNADKSFKDWWEGVKSKVKETSGSVVLGVKTGISKTAQKIFDVLTSKKKQKLDIDIGAKITGSIEELQDFWNGLKDGFKNIGVNFTGSMSDTAKDVYDKIKYIKGLKSKITRKFTLKGALGKGMTGIYNKVKSLWAKKDKVLSFSLKLKASITDLKSYVNEHVIDKINSRFADIPVLKRVHIPRLATGGMVDTGQLFIARENGAELVGNMNGHTTVANNDQIIEGIRKGVADGMRMANASGNQSVTVVLEGDAQGIFKVVQKQAKSYTAKTGSYAF